MAMFGAGVLEIFVRVSHDHTDGLYKFDLFYGIRTRDLRYQNHLRVSVLVSALLLLVF